MAFLYTRQLRTLPHARGEQPLAHSHTAEVAECRQVKPRGLGAERHGVYEVACKSVKELGIDCLEWHVGSLAALRYVALQVFAGDAVFVERTFRAVNANALGVCGDTLLRKLQQQWFTSCRGLAAVGAHEACHTRYEGSHLIGRKPQFQPYGLPIVRG